jgi:hypothetical protein
MKSLASSQRGYAPTFTKNRQRTPALCGKDSNYQLSDTIFTVYFTYKRRKVIMRMVCNCCGKILKSEQGTLKEECITVEHTFGYFSKKDGVHHKIYLCEECYDKITGSFTIPADEYEETTLI